MKLLGRDIGRFWRRLHEAPLYLMYFLKCIWLFKSPFRFIAAYVTSKGIPSKIIEMRDGTRIFLSDHPHDVISVFVVFIREDYGPIPRDATVIDIGANIGLFALLAARSGAARIIAYEPCTESLQIMRRNIKHNGLEHLIECRQEAVVGTPQGLVRFPARSSMYNAIIANNILNKSYDWVPTVGLAELVDYGGTIDFLKLDCEGAEYDIIFSADEATFSSIKELRMEYHAGHKQMIIDHLKRFGYVNYHAQSDSRMSGNLWFRKSDVISR